MIYQIIGLKLLDTLNKKGPLSPNKNENLNYNKNRKTHTQLFDSKCITLYFQIVSFPRRLRLKHKHSINNSSKYIKNVLKSIGDRLKQVTSN